MSKTKNIRKQQKLEGIIITKLFKLQKEIKNLKRTKTYDLFIKEPHARRNFWKLTAIRQTSFAQFPPSAELRVPARRAVTFRPTPKEVNLYV